MTRQHRYILIALVLQVLMVLLGQVSEQVLGLSGLFGMGIPLVVGWFYSVRRDLSLKDATVGGLLVGAVGAAVGLVLAVILNHGPWSLLPLGTAASALTGWLGSFLGWTLKSRKEPAAAE